MIKFIQKLIILWEKKKFLTLMELESFYISKVYQEEINRDLDFLRSELGKIKKKAETRDNNLKRIEIESKINESEKFIQMIKSSKEKSNDLKNQIALYKKSLWKRI
jgi:hypothetical protein